MHSRLTAPALLILLAACSTAPEGKYDYDPQANFAGYGSYAWAGSKPGVVVSSAEAATVSPLTAQRITAAINRELSLKGLSPAHNPELIVIATLGARRGIDVQQWGGYYGRWGYWGGGDVTVSDYTEGTLAVDLFDAKSKKALWRGYTSKRLGSGPVSQEEIDQAVSAIFANYPPPKGAV